jgi:predicted nuclease of predicted toxin-antitoxin system
MIWVDAHISPAIAQWISTELGYLAGSVRDLGLRHAKDKAIFAAARQASAVVMTKDADFAEMVERLGPPPSVIWLTCGNTSNSALRELLRKTLPRAMELITKGDRLVEISDKAPC